MHALHAPYLSSINEKNLYLHSDGELSTLSTASLFASLDTVEDDAMSVDDEKGAEESSDAAAVAPNGFGALHVPRLDVAEPTGEPGCLLDDLARRLRAFEILSDADMIRIQTTRLVDPLEGSLLLLEKWHAHKDIVLGVQAFMPNAEKYPGVQQTTFRPDVLAMLAGQCQAPVTTYLVESMRDGFTLGFEHERQSATHTNPPMENPAAYAAITSGLASDVEKGFTLPLSTEVRNALDYLVVSPLFAIQKRLFGLPIDKWRRIHNLSRSDASQPLPISVNGGIDPDLCSVSYTTLNHAAKVLHDSGPDSEFVAADAAEAFRIIPMAESEWPLLGLSWENQVYLETRLVFGTMPAPAIYQCLTSFIAWLLVVLLLVPNASAYLDDFLCITRAGRQNAQVARILILVFSLLGMPLNMLKFLQGVAETDYLGIHLNARLQTMSLPTARLAALRGIITEWLLKPSATMKELERLLGSLVFACRIIPQAKIFLRRLFQALAWSRANGHAAVLGDEQKRDLRWWDRFLLFYHNTCPLLSFELTAPWQIEFWTDASDFAGGGYLGGRWFQIIWNAEWRAMPIAIRELMAVVMACLTWGHEFTGKHMLIHCDNTNAIFEIQKMKSKSKSRWVYHLLRVLSLHAALHHYTYRIEYIESELNTIADVVSRKSLTELSVYFASVPSASLVPQAACLPPSVDDATWEDAMCQSILRTSPSQPQPLPAPASGLLPPAPPPVSLQPTL